MGSLPASVRSAHISHAFVSTGSHVHSQRSLLPSAPEYSNGPVSVSLMPNSPAGRPRCFLQATSQEWQPVQNS